MPTKDALHAFECRNDQPERARTSVTIASTELCAGMCEGDPACRAFWFDTQTRQCTLTGEASENADTFYCRRRADPPKPSHRPAAPET